MRGRFYIDGVDSLVRYGVFVMKNGYTPLFNVPAFKQLDITSWLDEDGVEVDLSEPKLQSANVSITFGFCDIELLEGFYGQLISGSTHYFEFDEIGLAVNMRLITVGSLSGLIRMGKISLSFAIDEVHIPSSTPYPIGTTRVAQRGTIIDGVDMSQYGCWILSGSYHSQSKPASVKQNLRIDSKYISGAKYYPQNMIDSEGKLVERVVKCSRDVTLSLLINARSGEEFWRCYNSLLSHLTSAGIKKIQFEDSDETHDFHYKLCSAKSFDITRRGTWWLMFDLTITLING